MGEIINPLSPVGAPASAGFPKTSVARVLYELLFVVVVHLVVWAHSSGEETWAETVSGTVLGALWLSISGNSPVSWLFLLATLQATDARWNAFTAALVERFGDPYDGFAGWALGGIGFLIFFVVYFGHGLLLLPLDLLSIQRTRIQPGESQVFKRPWRLAKSLAVNIMLTFAFTAVMTAQAVRTRGEAGYRFAFGEGLPTKQQQVTWFLTGLVWNEVNFYYSHRLMHHPRLYAKCHKQHHEYTAPFALMAIYSHPVEHLISNLWAFLGICSIARFHAFFTYCWVAGAVMGTQTHHSGFRFPWIAEYDHQPDFHDLHHQLFTTNFGNTGLLDRLHGTARDPWEARAELDKKKKAC